MQGLMQPQLRPTRSAGVHVAQRPTQIALQHVRSRMAPIRREQAHLAVQTVAALQPEDAVPSSSGGSVEAAAANQLPAAEYLQRFPWGAALAVTPLCLGGGDSGNGPGGSGGGGGGGGGGTNEVFVLADDAEEDEEEEESEEESEEEEEEAEAEADGVEEPAAEGPGGTFQVSDIRAEGLPKGEGIPTEEDLFSGLSCSPGMPCTRQDLSEDIKALYNTGLFESVNARVVPAKKKGKFSIVFDFVEKRYPEIQTFNVEGAKVLPPGVVEEVRRKLKEFRGQPFTMQTMAAIKNSIEGWYTSRGFGISYISHFTGMPTGDVVAHVVEGKTTKVSVVYVDEAGNPLPRPPAGAVSSAYILKHSPVEVGTLYNMADGRRTLQNVFALDLFDNVQILPRQSEKDPSKVEVEVMVREKPTQTADLEMEWAVAPGDTGRPSLVSLVPGGTISYENRNLFGRAATVAASINTKNFLSPADDLSYRFMYSLPYMNGLNDPKRTRLSATLFNSRKMCGVFTPGPGGDEVPPVWVDRMGAKVAVSEQYSRNSRGSLGLVAQQVSTVDESGAPCSCGMRLTPFGQQIEDGPPTCLGSTGTDRMVYAQGSLVRDTTYFVNGAQVGARDVFTVDQGLGIGTKNPFFNRFTAAGTRFVQLTRAKPSSKAAPVTLVAHGRLGNTLGDLPAYDAFLLGGPYSVRGFNYGELAACRRFVEGAVELRAPLPRLNTQAFVFAEAGHDLGSSAQVRGNPTEYYRRAGSGSSLGAGVKLGNIRAEAIRDNNSGRWSAFFTYGERF